MKTYILKRLLLILPNLFGITLISYGIIRFAPGDPAAMIMGTGVSGQMSRRGPKKEDIERFRHEYYLDKDWRIGYIYWLGDLCPIDFRRTWERKWPVYKGVDLGRSFKDRRPVVTAILEALPITIQINLISLFLEYLIAIPLGIFSAARQYSLLDRIITIFLFILYSLPSFWVATLCLMLLCGGDYWHVFPTTATCGCQVVPLGWIGRLAHHGWHIFLPVVCLTYGSFAFLSRQMRVGMLEQIRQDYVRTARAKGLSEKVVVLKHALRNSLIPVITLFASILPAMLGGSVIIERIFSVQGIGVLDFEAIINLNYPIVMGITTIAAILTLIGILIADILYVIVNPTISFE